MPPLESKVDPQGEAFKKNREEMLALVAQVRAVEERVEERGRRAAAKFAERGLVGRVAEAMKRFPVEPEDTGVVKKSDRHRAI